MDYCSNPMICIIWMQPAGARFRARCLLRCMGGFFRAGFHCFEHSRREDLGASKHGAGRGHGSGDRDFFRGGSALYFWASAWNGAAFFTRPFYDPASLELRKAVLGGTSIAVLTYIGFDGISTLSEEAENPRRNILLATVLVCVVIGILSAFQVYAHS